MGVRAKSIFPGSSRVRFSSRSGTRRTSGPLSLVRQCIPSFGPTALTSPQSSFASTLAFPPNKGLELTKSAASWNPSAFATQSGVIPTMLSLDDPRWTKMKGGYRIPFDPRPAFSRLEAGQNVQPVWAELWQELHHQGDVGEASYAAVPHLVRIHRERAEVDGNTYGIVSTIELARDSRKNPPIPEWLLEGYERALRDLSDL